MEKKLKLGNIDNLEKKYNSRFSIWMVLRGNFNFNSFTQPIIKITDTNNGQLYQLKIKAVSNIAEEVETKIIQIIEDTRDTKLNDIL